MAVVRSLRISILGAIQSQFGLAAALVRAMAFETTVGKKQPNVAIKLDLIGSCARRLYPRKTHQRQHDVAADGRRYCGFHLARALTFVAFASLAGFPRKRTSQF
jgi:hypothetical protein